MFVEFPAILFWGLLTLCIYLHHSVHVKRIVYSDMLDEESLGYYLNLSCKSSIRNVQINNVAINSLMNYANNQSLSPHWFQLIGACCGFMELMLGWDCNNL